MKSPSFELCSSTYNQIFDILEPVIRLSLGTALVHDPVFSRKTDCDVISPASKTEIGPDLNHVVL